MTQGHAHRHYHADMLSVEEARDRIVAHFHPLEPEERPLLECLGQVLAEDSCAPFDIPPAANSAMDGYAVRYDSIRGANRASPRTLRVVGEVPAGQVPQHDVSPGAAVRIMTGGVLPSGADTIIPFEDTDETERKARGLPLDQVAVHYEHPRDAHVRPAGSDLHGGDLVLERGTSLGPAELGVLASLGEPRARVYRRPVVAVLATGNELLEPGHPPEPGKVYNANNYSVAAAVLKYGGLPRVLGIARDDLSDLAARL